MGVKFGMEEGTFGPLLHAKFHPHRCNVSPLRGEKPQNRPLSKLNTGRFALRAMLPVTRHRASTSMYSLTFRVRVTTPPQCGLNGTASLQITSRTQQARRFYRCRGQTSPACVMRAVGLADYRWPLSRISSVAIATQPVHRLQIHPILHN